MSVRSNISKLRTEFKKPPPAFRPLALWFWNGNLTERDIRGQVRELKAGGCGGFIMHSRRGHDVPYLSESWWELVKAAVVAARENGLSAWIYDEDDWPSGSAGGRVTEGRPELQSWALTVSAAESSTANGHGEIIASFRARFGGGSHRGGPHRDGLHGSGAAGEILREWKPIGFKSTVPQGSLSSGERLILCRVFRRGYVDLLNPEVTRRFLALTHRKYEERFGAEFGKTIQGVFTDEPQIPQWAGSLKPAFPWTPRLPELFSRRYGYDILTRLPLLAHDGMDRAETVKTRCDFWRLVSGLLEEGFFRQVGRYCESRGLLFSGHVMDEEDLFGHVRMQGDLMRNLGHMHVPGVDHLFTRTDESYLIEGAACSYRVAEGTIHVKHASSAAHLHSAGRCLVECFGGAGWDLTPARMKRIVNWLAALGVNIFSPHGYYCSIEGRRKIDWPPSHFTQSTYWRFHGHLADYMGRVSRLLTEGVHAAPIALLYPLATMHANYRGPSERGGRAGRIDESYRMLCHALTRLGFDFDVVTEPDLQRARFEGGRILIGSESFSVLILPASEVISGETAEAALDFLQGGGNLLALAQFPRIGPDGRSHDAHLRLERLVRGRPVHGRTVFFPRLEIRVLASALRSWVQPDSMLEGRWMGSANRVSRSQAPRTAHPCVPGGVLPDGIYACQRHGEDFDVFYYANDTEESFSGTSVIRSGGHAELWDFETGEIFTLYAVERSSRGVEVPIELGPFSAAAVVVHQDGVAGRAFSLSRGSRGRARGIAPASRHGLHGKPDDLVIALPRSWEFCAHQANQLPLLSWEARIELNEDGEAMGWQLPGGQKRSGGKGWQPVKIDMGPPPGSLFIHTFGGMPVRGKNQGLWYRTRFSIRGRLPDPVSLTTGWIKGNHVVFVNGVRMSGAAGASVGRFLKTGRNSIAVRIESPLPSDSSARMDYSDIPWGILEPPRLKGRFAVWFDRDGTPMLSTQDRVLGLGNWAVKGYRYYSGTATYSAKLELDRNTRALGSLTLDLGEVSDVAELSVNGIPCGTRPWPPYSFDVTGLLKPGSNRIEIDVTNGPANGLLPPEVKYDRFVPRLYGLREYWYQASEPLPSGLLGPVKLVAHV